MGSKRANTSLKKRKRKKHGFRARMQTPGGKNVIKRRRKKGRKQLSVKVPKFKGV